MGLISVGTHHYKIKKQNSKMYYTTFTEPYKYFRKGFYKVIINKNFTLMFSLDLVFGQSLSINFIFFNFIIVNIILKIILKLFN